MMKSIPSPRTYFRSSIAALAVAALLSSGSAFSAEHAKKKSKTKAADPVATSAPASPSYSSRTSSSGGEIGELRWSVSGPFTLLDGHLFLGAYVNGMYRLNGDFSVGGESGIMFHSGDGVSQWVLPLAAKGMYHFH